jgi:hypothetical protein
MKRVIAAALAACALVAPATPAAADTGRLDNQETAHNYRVWLERHDFSYPVRTLRAARRADIGPARAAVLLRKESGGGRNVFGCDHGPGVAFCHEAVTDAKVDALLRSSLANGVGPTQLTFKPFVREAEALGGAHRPQINMTVGFRIFERQRLANGGSTWAAAKLYNGAASYADDFMRRLRGVKLSLRGAGVL